MSSQVSENLQPSPELNNNSMPSRTTPSPDAVESGLSWFTYQEPTLLIIIASELKLPRKREREVSLEPATTPTASNVLETRLCFLLSVLTRKLFGDRIWVSYLTNERIALLL